MSAFGDLRRQYAKLLLFATVIVILDQATKQVITHTLSVHENFEVIPGFFSVTHIRNTGGAFGLLAGKVTVVRTLFFLAVSVLALGIVFYFYSTFTPGKPWLAAAFALIFGGALGNLIDRLRFGEVIDFLDFYIGSVHWPAFNVADSAISVGAGILFFSVLLRKI